MRTLEIIIPILLAVHALWSLLTRRPRPTTVNLLPFLALLLTIAHLLLEGYRWQMIPLYALTALITLLCIPALLRKDSSGPSRRGWGIAASVLTLVLLILATALPALLPVPRVSAPSGPHQVGTQTFVVTDTSRQELYSGKEEPRKFMIQVWYPATLHSGDIQAPWMQDADIFAPAIAEFLNLPTFFLDHLALTKIPAFLDASPAPAENGYPIILFSHGWNGFAAQNSAQMVELASHGYVAVALQHTYGAMVTVFPDGQVARNNPDALPEGMTEPGYTIAARLLVNQWAGDLSAALDYLAGQNTDPSSSFHGLFDLTKVGVYGHSTGGGATIQFCGTDARCSAGLTQDAFMTPVSQQVLDEGVKQPFFFIFSQSWADDVQGKNNQIFEGFYSHLPFQVPVVTILGTRHYDFTDLPLLSPLAPQLGIKGPINGKRVVKILNDYLIAFFDQELKGMPSPLPFGPSEDYPDLRWEKK